MSGVRGPAVVLCVLTAVAAPGVFGQTAPLNPTVRVLERPQSIVPPDCDMGLAPAAPRPVPVEVAALERIEPRNVPPPPASDLRTRLRRVQTAAENGDYASFKSTLDEARKAVSGYPGGGEKQSATDVLQVYGDLERLWDYAMTSPTGSFFDASSADGAIINALRRYPEFPRAVADATMNIGGQSVYPATETRKFLTEEAAKRLRSLGVRTPSRVVQETPVPRSVAPRPTPVPRTVVPQPRPTSRTTPRTTPKATSSSTARKTPVAKSGTSAPKKQPAPRIAEKPAIAKPAPPPPVKVARVEPPPAPQPQPQPQPQPVTQTTATTATTATETSPPMSTDTTPTTDTTTSSAAPVETATTAAEAAKPAPEKTSSRGVNLPFAIILIVIGIAVLVLLFRSSD